MQEMFSEEENANLLWTGGWDSTFQLLQLLIIHRRRVTPFYLIDAERPSTGMEIRTIKRIKERLLKEYPHIHQLLQPTRYFAAADVSPDAEITEVFWSIRKEKKIGIQYEFLARFCKQNGITDMQLCIHNAHRERADFVFERIVSEGIDDIQTDIRIDPKFEGMNEYVLFRYFSFPIIKLNKMQMYDLAKERGWQEIMSMTWFCHHPTNNLKPCGKCDPCFQAIKAGLGWRIPMRGRIASVFHKRLYLPVKSLTKLTLSRLGLVKFNLFRR